MTHANARRTTITIGGDAVTLEQNQVDRLVRVLHAYGTGAADAVAEELSALSLARVRVDLLPTRAELDALIHALVRLEANAGERETSFARILGAARGAERG